MVFYRYLKGQLSIFSFSDIYIDLWMYIYMYIYLYIDILRDIHMNYFDIYMWISCSRCGYLSMCMDIQNAIMTR